jgi:hypothetical protein
MIYSKKAKYFFKISRNVYAKAYLADQDIQKIKSF